MKTNRISQNIWFKSALVFLAFFGIALFAGFLKPEFWSNDDPYYHVKHSQLMIKTGNYKLVEPWLEYTFFSYAPNDPWWGYHVILACFIKIFGSYLGAKVLTAINAAAIFTVYNFLLYSIIRDQLLFKSEDDPKPPVESTNILVWTFLFFASSGLFLYRMMLERPFVLSISGLLLAYWFLLRRKHLGLFILSFGLMLLYNLAPLVVFLAIFYMAVEFIRDRKIYLKPLISSLGGILVGIIFHPSGLNYLYVIYIHFWRTFFLEFSGVKLNIGSESTINNFFSFAGSEIITLGFFILSVVIYFGLKSFKKNYYLCHFFALSVFWGLITLLVRRGLDFSLPFVWIFIALGFYYFTASEQFVIIKGFLRKRINSKIVSFFAAAILLIFIANNLFVFIAGSYSPANQNLTSQYFADANAWLKANTPSRSLVFYDNWSYWPMMFYYNEHNRYLLGVAPTFMYDYSPRLFWLWYNLVSYGVYCNSNQKDPNCPTLSAKKTLAGIKYGIKNELGGDIVLLTNRPDNKLLLNIKHLRKDFIKVYENKDLLIYKLL